MILESYLYKDNRRSNRHGTIQLREEVVFALVTRAVHIHLGDTFDRKLISSQLDSVGVWREHLCILHDGIGEGSREQQGLLDTREHSRSWLACLPRYL